MRRTRRRRSRAEWRARLSLLLDDHRLGPVLGVDDDVVGVDVVPAENHAEDDNVREDETEEATDEVNDALEEVDDHDEAGLEEGEDRAENRLEDVEDGGDERLQRRSDSCHFWSIVGVINVFLRWK